MRWIEIVTLRSPQSLKKEALADLFKAVADGRVAGGAPDIRLYHHATVEGDLSVHIHWKGAWAGWGKSALGLRLANELMEFGLINHTVWIEEEKEGRGQPLPGIP